jgi:hypothetical protein
MDYCPEDIFGQPTDYRVNPSGGASFGDGMNRFMSKWNFEDSTPVSRADGSYTNRFMLDRLSAVGAVILPFSYESASLQRSADGHAQFSFKGYSSLDSFLNDPGVWVDRLETQIASVHQVWPRTPIVVIGHSQGGFLAEQYWERKEHDQLRDGVSTIVSLDSPINGIKASSGPIGLPITVLVRWGELWKFNFPAGSPQGLRDFSLSALDLSTAGVFRPIGVRFDPTYSSRFGSLPGGNYDLGAPGILTQILVPSDTSCDSAENCPPAPVGILPPSFVGPHECDVTQADIDRQDVKYDGSVGSDTGHFVVKYCPAIVNYVDSLALSNPVAAVPRTPPVVALGNSVVAPASAGVHSRIRVTGYGFEPRTSISVSIGPVDMGSFSVDSMGWLDVRLRVPSQLGPGTYTITAIGTGFNDDVPDLDVPPIGLEVDLLQDVFRIDGTLVVH